MQSKELEKINIVCSGGEMRGGYVGGFLDSFVKEVDLERFEITFHCLSASVPTVLFYLSHGRDIPAEEIWVNRLSKEGKYIHNGFLKLDMNGILQVFKTYHLNIENIINNRHTIIFPIYNIHTRKNVLVSNKKNMGDIWIGDYDIYELIHAAIAAPVLYGKPVSIGGQEYCDPALVTSFIFPENEHKTIFVTQNKHISHNKLYFIFILFYSTLSKSLPYRWMSLFTFKQKREYRKIKMLVKKGVALHMEPCHKLIGGGNMLLTKKDLKYNFFIGQKTFKKNKNSILNFLKPVL